MTLNFHKKPQPNFVFHFFFFFYYSLFILFVLLFIFFSSARRCARNCVLAYRELRANRPQTKSVPSQIGPSQIGPRSNHCIIMVFFYCFTPFFHTGKSHVRKFFCLLLSTCKVKYFLNSLDTIQQNI